MSKAVIVEGISKQYYLGQLERSGLLREALANCIKSLGSMGRNRETIWALRDVSFSVDQGDVVGIIGRNGAGKSTLLKVLSRITYPTTGRMRVVGRLASLLEVGTGFHEELTGRENIYLNGSILGMRKREIDKQMDSIVEFADVARFLDTPVKRYSSGMRLRLGFAVAAHLEPDVLLVDEVLAVGDAGFQKKCLGAMSNLNAGGRTVLFVSHNLTAVESLCKRTIWIESGRIREDGDSREVIQKYLSTFTEASSFRAELTDISHRKGSGEARLTRFELLDSDGRPLDLLRSGMPVTMRLHYEVQRRLQEPHFGIEIYTNTGTLVTSIDTWTAGYNIESVQEGRGHIDVRVPSLNINPDRYYFSFWIASLGPKYYDQLDLCLALDIEAADVHNSGRSLSRWYGVMFVPCEWENHHSIEELGGPFGSDDVLSESGVWEHTAS